MAGKRKFDWRAAVIGITVLGGVLALFRDPPSQLIEAEEVVFDQYQEWRPRPYMTEDPEAPGEFYAPPVRVIDIDEASLRELGQWPWPRTFLAELVDRLAEVGAAVVIFDVAFVEPDRTSPAMLAETLPRFGAEYGNLFEALQRASDENATPVPDHDAIFAEALARYPTVIGVIPSDDPGEREVPIKKRIQPLGPTGAAMPVTRWPYAINSRPILSEAASGIGLISLARDEGQTIRRVPIVQEVGGELFPVLSAEGLRVALGVGSILMKTTQYREEQDFSGGIAISSVKIGPFIVPTDADGAVRVRYSGVVDERVVSARDVLADGGMSAETANRLAGQIVFVGSSAPTLFDVKTTPLTDRISGVHIHAELVEQIFQGAYLTRPDWEVGLTFLLMIVGGLLIVGLLSFNMPLLGFGTLIVALGGVAGGSWYLFVDQSLLLSPLGPALAVALPHFTVSGFKYFVSEAGRREVTRQFEHFVSPEVIQDIIDDPERYLTPGGAQRELSIMFLDVRRFSTITEKMEPQEVIAFINKLLTPLTDAIIAEQGTIDKYMGDAVMAFWNAPRETPEHEMKAIRAMLAMGPIMERLNGEFTAMGLPDIGIGVGINTGLCSVGNMGSLKRLAYSCVGDSVNLASRLEGQTKAYGVGNLIGAKTANGAPGFPMIELDSVAVKGRTQPETIYTVAGLPDVTETEDFQMLQLMLTGARAAYLAQQWDGAEEAFAAAAKLPPVGVFDPAGYCGIMIERIAEYRENPPPEDWDGVYVATSK